MSVLELLSDRSRGSPQCGASRALSLDTLTSGMLLNILKSNWNASGVGGKKFVTKFKDEVEKDIFASFKELFFELLCSAQSRIQTVQSVKSDILEDLTRVFRWSRMTAVLGR